LKSARFSGRFSCTAVSHVRPNRAAIYFTFDCQPCGILGGSSVLHRKQRVPGPAQSSCGQP
jgi:hypothetical protein